MELEFIGILVELFLFFFLYNYQPDKIKSKEYFL